MELSELTTKIVDFCKQNQTELSVMLVSSVLYHFYQKNRGSGGGKETKNHHLQLDKLPTIKKQDSAYHIPLAILSSENSLIDEIQNLYSPTCKIVRVPHLVLELGFKDIPSIKSPLLSGEKEKNMLGGQGFIPEKSFIYKGSFVLSKNNFHQSQELLNPTRYLLAGPRKFLHFKPTEVKAAIVTCGGLCPGLNVVIREIFTTLSLYGCQEVWGIRYGYMGFYSGKDYWLRLHENIIKDLQYQGGTEFGSSRGGFDAQKIINSLVQKGINQLFVIGGDGTHRGIAVLANALKQKKLQISIVGIPKTIDNDIPIIDKSFGFETAVSESIRAIRSAYVESRGIDYGIGLVRLMGRNAGFIAMNATNASRDVDICLVPEFQFDLYGKNGVMEYIFEELKVKRHLVIVVAEGAGEGVRDLHNLSEGVEKDGSGNIKLPDIGAFLKVQIIKYLKQKGLNATLKYIDPAYMIRSVPANSYDRKMCAHLASNAVHGAMAGYTSFTVGHINQYVAMIPISSIGAPNRIKPNNRAWQRMLAYTGQPCFQNIA